MYTKQYASNFTAVNGGRRGAESEASSMIDEPSAAGVVTGGRNLYGCPLGVLMLQSRFPRIPGDAGNASTWPFPVSYRIVAGADPDTVIRRLAESDLLDAFTAAALDLQAEGVSLVTTNCGFLVLYQQQIQTKLDVPFLSSSLLQVRWLQQVLPPGRTVGIITLERASLTDRHLAAAGLDSDVPVVGMEEVGEHFVAVIAGDRPELDVSRARAEHVAAGQLMRERHPDVDVLVLECTNMPPYAAAIAAATGLPVHDFTTLMTWAVAARRRSAFTGWM